MKQLLILSLIMAIISAVTLVFLVKVEKQYDDCRFECNHLQTQLARYEELNDIVPALYQILPPIALAELKVATLQIRNMKHEAFESREMPLVWE